MTSFEFDNVKAEKEDALWRYNMEKKLKTGFLLALFLFSCSWFSTFISATLEVAGDFRRRFVSTFNEPLFTFVLLNFIIAVVYILSSQKHTQKQATRTDIYDEYVRSSRRSIPTSAAATEEITVDKQIIFEENSSPLCPEKQLETTVDTDTNISVSAVKQLTTALDRTVLKRTKPAVSSAELKEKEYRRSGSMVSESREQRPMEFGRSKTAIGGGEVVISGIEPPRKLMEEMSSEEFQLSVDSFIAERKKILVQENTAITQGDK
ncbi:hypothetical protein like AT5G66440 [Hibiscus trionum]|uniref:CYP722 protein n=1 Tax=Hibiscus trionum TaxID=183268 RepID=A0A9W7HUA3_HIBTR|nr:hypothetical protein like AT5G66440 [Hibiscus trionum]